MNFMYEYEFSTQYPVSELYGNVMEWTGADFEQYPYEIYEKVNDDANKKSTKVIRGRSFEYYKGSSDCLTRTMAPSKLTSDEVGFRCAK